MTPHKMLKTEDALTWTWGFTSLIGTIVTLSGIRKEYRPTIGMNVGNNIYLDTRNGGAQMTLLF